MSETPAARPKQRMFPGRANQIAHARDFTRRVLGPCPVLDEAVLLVSELATNALEHTATGNAGSFHVTICPSETSLLIAVTDNGSDESPLPRPADRRTGRRRARPQPGRFNGRSLGLLRQPAQSSVWAEMHWLRVSSQR